MTNGVRVLVDGNAEGSVVRLDEPLSFWGGFDPTTGRIIDSHHPQCGESLTGVILAMRSGRGSSSSTGVLAEAIRLRTAPAAIVLASPDIIVSLAAQVAHELYGITFPVLVVDASTLDQMATGSHAQISPGGRLAVTPHGR